MTMWMKNKFDKMKKCMVSKSAQTGLHRISLQLLLSYFAIMLAPAIAVGIVYNTASDALLDVQKERAYRLLSENAAVFEQQIDELQNLSGYLAEDDRLRVLAERVSVDRNAEFYSMFELVKELPNYTLTNRMIDDVHIIMKGKHYLMQLPTVAPISDRGFHSVKTLGFLKYEDLLDAVCAQHFDGDLVQLLPGNEDSPYVVVHSIVSRSKGDVIGAVIFSLNENTVKRLMENSMVDESSAVLITDAEGNLVGRYGSKQTDLDTYQEHSEDYIKYEKMTGGGYNWRIISITPLNSLIHLIGAIKYIIILLCVASIAIGIFLCLLYWYRRKPVVGRYYSFGKELAKGEVSKGFWHSLNAFLDGVQNLKDNEEERKEILQREIIGRVLSGGYDSEEELREDFEEIAGGMPEADGYYLMVFQYVNPGDGEEACPHRRLAEEIRKNFSQCIGGRYWVYEISRLTYALILADENKAMQPDVLKHAVERLNYSFYREDSLSVYTGISSRAASMMELEKAYEEAYSVCAYARFFSIRLPLCRSDLPGKTENFSFPIDVELELEQTILHGSAGELEKMLGEIRERYLKGSSRLAMLQYYLELLRGIAMRAVEKLKEENDKEKILRRLQEAGTQEEIFGAIRWLQDCFLQYQRQTEKTQDARRKAYFEEVVEDRYSDASFNLAEFSDLTGIPQRRLYREFSECVGQTFSDYLEKVRIRNACRMLTEDMAVKDVAQKAGYASDYSFRRAFKRVIGMAPSEYQKKEK